MENEKLEKTTKVKMFKVLFIIDGTSSLWYVNDNHLNTLKSNKLVTNLSVIEDVELDIGETLLTVKDTFDYYTDVLIDNQKHSCFYNPTTQSIAVDGLESTIHDFDTFLHESKKVFSELYKV